jgi:hypothetical protein
LIWNKKDRVAIADEKLNIPLPLKPNIEKKSAASCGKKQIL